ncbi:3-coathanger stack domain-containing protein [Emticicia agri]
MTSANNVNNGVNYFAGKSILLIPGFQVGGNEVFMAKIEDCP